MAGPSDKARFYLEQSATELNDLERKKIFTRDEISSIARKRSDFEHIINARGSQPSDYQRYIEFEKNVDALRRKRFKRLGVRYKGAGQRTIYFLYTRATRKFSGDLTLWMQYIDFARKDKAYKRLNDIFTAVARLHPTKPELWILAANYFMDTQADITNARSYMQRGLRFCKNSENLWLEYAKLETIYVGKIAGRRKILGLDGDRMQPQQTTNEDVDMIALPQITAEDIDPTLKSAEGATHAALQSLDSAPVLTGAIPLAIFDSAMKQFRENPALAEHFMGMFADFDQLLCIPRILQHIVDFLEATAPDSVELAICKFKKQLFGYNFTDPDFAHALRDALEVISSAMQRHPNDAHRLCEVAIRQLVAWRSAEDLDPGLQKVRDVTLRKYVRLLGEKDGERIVQLAQSLQREGKRHDSEALMRVGIKSFAANETLQRLQASSEK